MQSLHSSSTSTPTLGKMPPTNQIGPFMKASYFLTAALTLMVVGCAKGGKKDNVLPIIPKASQAFSSAEQRCQLVGVFETKEVFVKQDSKNGVTVVSFHELISEHKYSKELAKFEGFTLPVFKLRKEVGNQKFKDEIPAFSGSEKIAHQNLSDLSIDGEVTSVVAVLRLNYHMEGSLTQRQTVMSGNKSISDTKTMDLADIKDCEKSEATPL